MNNYRQSRNTQAAAVSTAGSWLLPTIPPPPCLSRSFQFSSGAGAQSDVRYRKGSGMSVPGHTLATHTTRGKSSGVYPLSNQGGGAPAELRAAVALMVELMGLPPVDPPRRTGPSTCGPCGSIMPLRPHGITYIAERQGFVKIGSTGSRHSLTTRLRTLRTPGAVRCPEGMDERLPLNIVAVLDDPVEHKLHEWYAEYHVIGEWFHAEPVKAALFSAVSV